MRKRIGALILVITMVLTMLPTTVFATESQMSEEFASILNENGDLEITWSCHEEGMKEILSEWVTNNKSDDVYGSFRVDAYDELTDKVTLTFIGTNGEEESHEVDLIINEQFSDTFQAILTDGQIVLPTTCNNISIEWINSYLYDFDNTYAFWIGHYTDDAGETISLIDEGCTSATIKMYGKNSSDVEYHKVELSRMTEMSEEFRDYLNSDGKVYMNAAPPQDEWDFYDLFSLLIGEDGVGFYNLSQDFKTIDFCVGYEMHTVEIEYDYDPAIQAKIRPYMEELPLDKLFAVRDLELINYWVNNVGNEDEDTLDAYSGELKECIGYNNITYYVDNRMGMDEPFYTERFGIALFLYKDAVYYANSMLGTCAEHVIYVPDETANTSNALKEAAQKRIDEYIGVGKVELQDAGTVKDVLKVFYPDALDDELQDYICVEDVTGDEPAYKLVVSGESGAEKSYYIVVKRDSTKRLTPSYEVADLETEIIINSTSSEIPLDTKIQSEKLTSGTEYEKIVDLLDVETNETYDINLYSDSIQDNITKLENGTFEVQIPISNELKDKELVAYYVDENNQIIEYEVEVTDDGNASFSTNHFSIYTIAPVDEIEEEPDDPVDPEEPDEPEYDIVEPEDNDVEIKVEDTIEELMIKIPFTEEEKALIDAGADVTITLKVKDIDETVSDTEKLLVAGMLTDETVGMYLDINLFKKVGDIPEVKIPDLNEKMTIQIKIPDEFINTDTTIMREYGIVRIHDGDAEILDVEYNESTKFLTVDTDHFSTYALVYVDKSEEQPEPIVPISPETGDVSILSIMATVSMCGIMICGMKKHRNR